MNTLGLLRPVNSFGLGPLLFVGDPSTLDPDVVFKLMSRGVRFVAPARSSSLVLSARGHGFVLDQHVDVALLARGDVFTVEARGEGFNLSGREVDFVVYGVDFIVDERGQVFALSDEADSILLDNRGQEFVLIKHGRMN